jgi:hypothetical protein
MPRTGYRTQPGLSTPGTAEPRKCALKGREHRENTRALACTMQESLAPSGRIALFDCSRVETLG